MLNEKLNTTYMHALLIVPHGNPNFILVNGKIKPFESMYTFNF